MENYKLEELKDSIQRLQAEFENYRKRVDKEKQDYLNFANAKIISKLWLILDNIEISLKNTENKEAFIEGIKLIFADLFNFLRNQGVYFMNTLGEKFDPYKHEVLMKEGNGKTYIVTEEYQKGYMLYDKILRTAKVKIKAIEEEKK